jgi:hypothetical protein
MLKDYVHNNGTHNWAYSYSTVEEGGTFIATSSYPLVKIGLIIHNTGSLADTVFTVSVRNTDANGKPIGGDLCSCSVSNNKLVANGTDYTKYNFFNFSSPANLISGTKYAIITVYNSTGATDKVSLTSMDVVSGGTRLNTVNSGTVWNIVDTESLNFETYDNTNIINNSLISDNWMENDWSF